MEDRETYQESFEYLGFLPEIPEEWKWKVVGALLNKEDFDSSEEWEERNNPTDTLGYLPESVTFTDGEEDFTVPAGWYTYSFGGLINSFSLTGPYRDRNAARWGWPFAGTLQKGS